MSDLDDGNARRSRELGMHRHVSRRDFLNGLAVGAGGTLVNQWLRDLLGAEAYALSAQDRAGYDPPTLNGMRGSHPGSFDVAHALRDEPLGKRRGR
jgi:spermidine dehydrogenase